MIRNLPALLVALALAAGTLTSQGLPLEIHNPTSRHLVGHPVSFGIPVPEILGFTDPEAHWFAIRTPWGQTVPRQFRVLSRWGGARTDISKPIRWVLVTFPADCPPYSTAIYTLGHGFSPSGSIVVSDLLDKIVVSPAPGASMTISKQSFSLFESVVVDGQTLVSAPGGGIRMRDAWNLPVAPAVTETLLEESGPVRTVVRQRGTLNELQFTARYTFHTGSKSVTVDFQLLNPRRYGHFSGATPGTEYFDHLKLWLPVQGSNPAITSRDATRYAGAHPYTIEQGYTWLFNRDLAANFHYAERLNGDLISAGNRYLEGSIDLSTSLGGVTASVDRFYENFPKAFHVVSERELEVALWPEGGSGPAYKGIYGTPNSTDPVDPMAIDNYRFEGGRSKNHRIVFDFHPGGRTPAEVRSAGELVQKPPAGRTSGWWFARTLAHGRVLVEKRPWEDPEGQRFEALMEVLHSDAAADSQNSVGKIGFPAFRNRGGYGGGTQWYGWDTFGDVLWSDGMSSLHYDWPYGVLVNWARGGSYGFLDVARDMVAHRRDYDQNHSTDPAESWRGAQFYEKGWWHGNYMLGQASHTWIGGLLLNYALTGDEMSYEAALKGLDYIMRHPPGNWTGMWGARIPGWSVEVLLDGYTYVGNPAYLAAAKAGVARFEELEANWGHQGYVMNAGNPTTPFVTPFMHGIMFCAAARYTMLSGDPAHLGLLHRMKTFLASTIIPGTGTPGAMTLPSVKYWVYPDGSSQGSHTHHTWYLANVFSHAALLFGEQQDKTLAFTLYSIGVRFHQQSPVQVLNYNDPSTWSKQGMHMSYYPGTESKAMGGMMNQGLSYLAARMVLAGW